MSKFYHEWRSIYRPSWTAFHAQWWAAAGLERLQNARKTGVLTVGQSDVCQELNILADTRGTMYLRDEVFMMYDRVLDAWEHRESGVAYTGMRACGKSTALLYVLLCRLADGQPVMFSAATGMSYIFDNEGVRIAQTAHANINIFDYVERSARMWSLLDHSPQSSYFAEPEYYNVGHFFPVHAVRFDGQHFSWTTKASALEFHMDPWTSSDILHSLRLREEFQQLPASRRAVLSTEAAIQNIVNLSGPTPTDALQEIMHPGFTESRIQTALRWVGLRDLVRLTEYISMRHILDFELASLLLLWKRHIPPRRGFSDLVDAAFKSELAFRLLSAHVDQLGQELNLPPSPIAYSVHDNPGKMLQEVTADERVCPVLGPRWWLNRDVH